MKRTLDATRILAQIGEHDCHVYTSSLEQIYKAKRDQRFRKEAQGDFAGLQVWLLGGYGERKRNSPVESKGH